MSIPTSLLVRRLSRVPLPREEAAVVELAKTLDRALGGQKEKKAGNLDSWSSEEDGERLLLMDRYHAYNIHRGYEQGTRPVDWSHHPLDPLLS